MVLLVAYAGFVGFVSWKSAESLVHPERPAFSFLPTDFGLSYHNASFPTVDGLALSGWWMPADDSQGTIIFLHGYGDSKNQSLEYATFLHNASYNVLAFDFRAHGESEGDLTTVGLDEVRDVRAAIEYAKTRDAEGIGLLGLSMGAATAINAAANEPDVRAIVADSAFATLQNIASNSISHFTDLPKYPYGPVAVKFASMIAGQDVAQNAPVRQIGSLTIPVLLIQGQADDIALPDSDGAALRAALPSSQFWLVPDAHHVEAHVVEKAAYEARVTEFFRRSVG